MTTTPPPAAQTREEGWYWVKTLKDTKRDFWSPAYFTYNDKPSGTISYWLDSWLDGIVEPTKIGPRVPAPDERAGDAALGDRLRALVELRQWALDSYCACISNGDDGDAENFDKLLKITDALTLFAPGNVTGWNEAIEAAAKLADAQFDSPPVDSMNVQRLGGWEDCADHLRVAIRALRKPSPPGAAEGGGNG
jgi:hypothetical protein